MASQDPAEARAGLPNGRSFYMPGDRLDDYTRFQLSEQFWHDNRLAFDRGGGIVVRAHLTEDNELVSLKHGDDGAKARLVGYEPIVRILFDGRDSADKQYTWELGFSVPSGSIIRQINIRPSEISGSKFSLDKRGNQTLGRSLKTVESALLLETVLELIEQPAAIEELAKTRQRRSGPVGDALQHAIDYTHVFPYVPKL